MGCDIHLYVERVNNEIWTSVDKWIPNQYFKDEDGCEVVVDYHDSFYHDRNYNLFAILANVRNGRGFTGVKTGDEFNIISEPRGIPDDCDSRIADEAKSWGLDGHSHSYHTITELLEFDWTQISTIHGVVDKETFMDWMRWGKRNGEQPKSWAGDVMGPNIKIISQEVAEEAHRNLNIPTGIYGQEWHDIHKKLLDELPWNHVRCQWDIPYYRACGTWWSETMPKLFNTCRNKNMTWRYDEVRIVFWFDN